VITSSPAITGIDGYFDTKNYGTLGVSDNLSDSSQIVGYNVWRTDETGTGPYTKLNGAPVTATTYVDTYPPTLEAGTFDYYVTAVYNDSQTGTFLCESPGSDTVEVEFPAIGINETGSGSIVIFPNPATEVVNVKSDAHLLISMVSVSLFLVLYYTVTTSSLVQLFRHLTLSVCIFIQFGKQLLLMSGYTTADLIS
jgi:hypothetical protein